MIKIKTEQDFKKIIKMFEEKWPNGNLVVLVGGDLIIGCEGTSIQGSGDFFNNDGDVNKRPRKKLTDIMLE
ncbi:MAG: hypothetical protein KAS32_13245 [Candidatus Peribacteraceae bacterium]|nr:hypothetical protein [Candidatus Peribacteraceae bacterium]